MTHRLPTSTRLVGVDVTRGIALLGMAATHMLAVRDPATGHLTTVGWLFAGRASATFAVVAGVSLALVSGATKPRTGAARSRVSAMIAVRAILIGLIGLWLAGIGSPVAVILAYYALFFLLTIPFLGLRPKTLLVIAASWALVSPVLSHLLRQHLPLGPNDQVSFTTVTADPVGALQELMVIGYYPVLTWMTYLLAGLAVGRLDLRARRTAVWLLGVGAGLAAFAWLTSVWMLSQGLAEQLVSTGGSVGTNPWWDLVSSESYGTTPPESWAWLAVAAPHTGTPFDLVGTTGSALAVLGLFLLVVRVDVLRWITHPIAAAGTMTLTLYTFHVFALSQPWGEWGSFGYYLTHVVVALVFSTVWLLYLRRGPMEWWVHRVASSIARLLIPDRRSRDGSDDRPGALR